MSATVEEFDGVAGYQTFDARGVVCLIAQDGDGGAGESGGEIGVEDAVCGHFRLRGWRVAGAGERGSCITDGT